MPVSEDKNMLFCRPLSAVMDHRRCTQLQRGDILRFPDFSQPSPLWRFHITASRRDDRRASTRRSFQKACVVPTPQRAAKGEYIDTSVVAIAFGGNRSEEGENRRSVSEPGQASERRVAQTGSEASLSAWFPHCWKDKAQALRCRLGADFVSSIWQQNWLALVTVSVTGGSLCWR